MAEKETPTHWTLGWSLEPELGFSDGTYLPRRAAVVLYPEYFDENGEPILTMLPMASEPKRYVVKKQKRGAGRAIFEERKRRCKDGRKKNVCKDNHRQ